MYEERVARGSAWLDKVDPGWYKKIDLSQLTLIRADRCSLGQTLGPSVSHHLCYDWAFAVPNGFALEKGPDQIVTRRRWYGKSYQVALPESDINRERHYSLLTSAWIQEILRRRAADRAMAHAVIAAQPKS